MSPLVPDLLRSGEVWEYTHDDGRRTAYVVLRRMNTYPAECHTAINLDKGSECWLYEVSLLQKWERIA